MARFARILRIDRITANIKIQCASGEVRTVVHGETGASRVGRFATQLLLVLT